MEIIKRYYRPGEYDQHAKGTICQVLSNHGDEIYVEYIQRSDDPEKPRWEKI